MVEKFFRVGTFYDKSDKLCLSNINAYVRDYNMSWKGCRVYEVEACSGAEAKQRAKEIRLYEEREKMLGSPLMKISF